MAVKKIKNWTRKKSQEKYDFDLVPKVTAGEKQYMMMSSSVDRISELPDDLMRSIVSLLTLREATVARILSSSWRHVDVDANVVSFEFPYPSYNAEQSVDQNRFLEYTNGVLDSYKGKGKGKGKFILKFKFDLSCCPALKSYFNLTNWFKSALMSVETTEVVDIHVIRGQTGYYYYQSPDPLEIFLEANECLKLKEVSLSGVRLDNWDIDLLLSKFVALERLSIEFVSQNGLLICNPNSKLKHLKITPTFLSNFHRVGISHLNNLVSLSYNGLKTDLDHVPKLVDVSIHSGARNIRDILPRIRHNVAAQLLRLHLYITLHHKTTVNHRSYGIHTQFTKLKHLELNVEIDNEINIQQLCPLIAAFPCIHELKVKFLWLCDPTCKHKRHHEDRMMNRMSEIGQLQVVMLSGCVGSVFEMELALYIINNASTLKELVLEPQDRNHPIQSRQIDRAFQHLLSVTPSYVDLILL